MLGGMGKENTYDLNRKRKTRKRLNKSKWVVGTINMSNNNKSMIKAYYTFCCQIVLVQVSYGVIQREYLYGSESAEQKHRINSHRRIPVER